MIYDMTKKAEVQIHRAAWKTPLNWPAGIWALVMGTFVMSLPFLIRMVILSGIPDLPELFDVAEFVKWEVPEEQDGFTYYRRAAKMRANLGSIDVTPNVEEAMNSRWSEMSEIDDRILEWLQIHHESLEVWRRGTDQKTGRYKSPLDLSLTEAVPDVQEQLRFGILAALELRRCLNKNEVDKAFEWGRAILRAGGHTTIRGGLILGSV